MFQIPVNRWTVALAAAVLAIFGGDFIAPIAKIVNMLTAMHGPAGY